MSVFKKKPLKYENQIPVFSEIDSYVTNYEKIGGDILNNIDIHGENPFMDEKYWNSIETSTLTLINDSLNENDRILDVGVGLGRLLNKVKKPVLKYGVDIDIKQLSRIDNSISVCMSKVEELPYKDNLFDVIVCTDVLEHVLDLNLAVENILRCLKPKGSLIIRVPYKEDLSNYLLESYPYEFAHLRNFDENNLRLLFEVIFKMSLSEITYCGYLNSRTRVKYFNNMRIVQKMIEIFIRGFSIIINGKTQDWLNKKLLNPIEINIKFVKNESKN